MPKEPEPVNEWELSTQSSHAGIEIWMLFKEKESKKSILLQSLQ